MCKTCEIIRVSKIKSPSPHPKLQKKTIIEQPDQDNILFNNIIFHDSNSAAEEILKSYLH